MKKNNKKYTLEEIKKLFNEKDYILVSTEYKNKDQKLEFICNKHKSIGVQYVSLNSFKRNTCNCKECIKNNSIGKKHNVPKNIEKNYDKYIKKYNDKLNSQNDGNEYILSDVYVNEKHKTILDLIHIKCGNHYHVEQDKFFTHHYRCTNKECKSERLTNRMIKSLEQFKNEIYQLIGDEYEVLGEYYGTNKDVTFLHKNCKNTFKMTPHNFLAGQRCIHCTRTPSTGEQKIIDYLIKNNIKYIFQHPFDDLLGINGVTLKYDFYLPEYNLLIEYQGEYHDGSISYISKSKFNYSQEHDTRKREYAISHNIHLLEIWYWDFENIEKILFDYLSDLNVDKVS